VAYHKGLVLVGNATRGSKNLGTKQNFSLAEVFFWTQNFKSENFMHIERSEKKFLKRSVGHKMRLYFWNLCQMTDLLLTQLTSYIQVLVREFEYSLSTLWPKTIYLLAIGRSYSIKSTFDRDPRTRNCSFAQVLRRVQGSDGHSLYHSGNGIREWSGNRCVFTIPREFPFPLPLPQNSLGGGGG